MTSPSKNYLANYYFLSLSLCNVHNSPIEVQLAGGGASAVASNNTFNPYDATSLHIFIREAFTGAVLLEEHQVL